MKLRKNGKKGDVDEEGEGFVSFESGYKTNSKTAKKPKPLKLVEVEITLRCPLKCIHCSVMGGEAKLDLSAEKYLELVEDCAKLQVETMDIIGGEPLVRPDIWDLLIETKKKIPNVIVNTAGFFVNEKIAKKLWDTGVRDVFVSIDGPTPEKHEMIRGEGRDLFEKTCRATRLLADFGFNVTVAFVCSAKTVDDIPAMVDLSRKLGAKTLYILGFIPAGRGSALKDFELNLDHISRVFEYVKQYDDEDDFNIVLDCSILTDFSSIEPPEISPVCPAGTTFVTVTVYGDVFPCGFLRDRKTFSAGNIYERRFYDIWLDDDAFGYFRRGIKGCENCPVYVECRGGCQARHLGKACEGKPQKFIEFFGKNRFIHSPEVSRFLNF